MQAAIQAAADAFADLPEGYSRLLEQGVAWCTWQVDFPCHDAAAGEIDAPAVWSSYVCLLAVV